MLILNNVSSSIGEFFLLSRASVIPFLNHSSVTTKLLFVKVLKMMPRCITMFIK